MAKPRKSSSEEKKTFYSIPASELTEHDINTISSENDKLFVGYDEGAVWSIQPSTLSFDGEISDEVIEKMKKRIAEDIGKGITGLSTPARPSIWKMGPSPSPWGGVTIAKAALSEDEIIDRMNRTIDKIKEILSNTTSLEPKFSFTIDNKNRLLFTKIILSKESQRIGLALSLEFFEQEDFYTGGEVSSKVIDFIFGMMYGAI